jgi:nitroreductase
VATSNLKKILEADRLAPSGSNLQPWKFTVVENAETKRALAVAASNQKFISDAEVVVVALGESKARAKISLASSRVMYLQEPMIAVDRMVLVVVALGHGTCWIGAFNEKEVKRIMRIPEDLRVVVLLLMSASDENPPARPRKAFGQIFFKEFYGNPLKL